eukprot:TRINITY_DN596_c11_g1_i1.p2 TRINITY_DN596_c11_g1~~TRINITY_DN596_c11_g1_i1.p2  ORF type:complete len:256 (+),score=71.24 TRINITY_DN596_c11_g1_i1:49-816(+)
MGFTMNATARRAMKRQNPSNREPDKRLKDDGADLIFNNLVFDSDKKHTKKEKKVTTETMLSRVQKVKERLNTLRGTEEGKEMSNNIHWDEALKRAAGEKVKSDPVKLKKAIKRAQKTKQRSKERWAAFTSAVEKAKEEGRAIPKRLTKPKPKKVKKKKPAEDKPSKSHDDDNDDFTSDKGGKKGGKGSSKGGKKSGKGSKGEKGSKGDKGSKGSEKKGSKPKSARTSRIERRLEDLRGIHSKKKATNKKLKKMNG